MRRSVTRLQFYDQVLADTRARCRVESAAWRQLHAVHDARRHGGSVDDDAGPDERWRIRAASQMFAASLRMVTPGYFQTLGIPLLQGRDVSTTDTVDTPAVAVVSRSFAEHYYPGQIRSGVNSVSHLRYAPSLASSATCASAASSAPTTNRRSMLLCHSNAMAKSASTLRTT